VRMTGRVKGVALVAASAIAIAGAAGIAGAQNTGDILIGEGVFPESITSTPDGGFMTGSLASPNIYRYSPGDDSASVWATVAGTTLGVFAAGDTAYACQINPATFGDGTLVTFDLATGEQTGAYAFPDAGLCNDIAVSPDGVVFVTDTGAFSGNPGGVYALVDGALVDVFHSADVAGADGLAFLGDTLYVNDVNAGAIWAIELDGTTMTSMTQLTLSRELSGPDGMRAAADGSGLYVAENAAGRVSFVTVDGDNATVDTVGEGPWESSTAVAEIGDTIYVIDTKFSMLGDPEAQPGPFYAIAVNGGM
jgi:sugar lactone lactonase YvrE